jgi:uncharacterized protein YxjI
MDTTFELLRGDSQQAVIAETGGQFSDRFTATLADGTKTQIDWDQDEQRYTITQAGQLAARLSVYDRWFRRQKYVLELSPAAEPILIIAICVVIDQARSHRHFPGP